jgi:hypothetical protein
MPRHQGLERRESDNFALTPTRLLQRSRGLGNLSPPELDRGRKHDRRQMEPIDHERVPYRLGR